MGVGEERVRVKDREEEKRREEVAKLHVIMLHTSICLVPTLESTVTFRQAKFLNKSTCNKSD